jgi:4-amino-4-deoxy-L-arabinose transferase-like glycosyltransferase
MTTPPLIEPADAPAPQASASFSPLRRSHALMLLCGLWLVIFFASLFTPPLLDDADSTHASAARHMALTGDLVTLHVDGVRYLEKAPLPYWLVALSFRIFGFNAFAAHFPQAIAVLLLALLGYHWSRKAFDDRTALYTGLAILTSVGVFLFTRIYIPEVLLSLLLCTAIYCLLQTLEPATHPDAYLDSEMRAFAPRANRFLSPAIYPYLMWTALALAVLTKGLVALVFFFGTAIAYLIFTGEYKNWRTLKPFTGLLLFFAIAAPWHILAGLRNTGGMNGHGFFWFYFINEHVLRFLGKRIPMDYNKLPGYLFWSLHLVWLFPWALFLGLLVQQAVNGVRRYFEDNPILSDQISYWQPFAVALVGIGLRDTLHVPYLYTVAVAVGLFLLQCLRHRQSSGLPGTALLRASTFQQRTTHLLTLYTALILIFFSLSTNQEYYTFPAYLPLLILLAASITRAEGIYEEDRSSRRWITVAHATFTIVGLGAAIALGLGLWSSRHLPYVADIGDLLAHRSVGAYTLSMSHFFDLTGPSFAALRLPAGLAALALAFGPSIAWWFRSKRRHLAATLALALTSTIFLIAAHIALGRFEPMLSSKDLAEKVEELEDDGNITRENQLILYGDQAYGSSILFYLGRPGLLVNGRTSSMMFGSTFPDAPPIFIDDAGLRRIWGKGERKILFVPLEKRDDVDRLLGAHKILLEETSGKALFTDRPLDSTPHDRHQTDF